MQIVVCNDCGSAVGIDDFINRECPVCDSSMEINRLNNKVDEDLKSVVRVKAVENSALVD